MANCRKLNVDAFTEISQIYTQLFILILIVWSLKHVATMIYIFQKKQNITKMQAQISLLRMNIKRNFRQKSNQFLQANGLDQKIIQEIKLNYKEISELDLAANENFQKLMLGLKKIYDLISQTEVGFNDQIEQIQSEKNSSMQKSDLNNNFENIHFWQKIYEADQPTMLSIFEIVALTAELKSMTDHFNSLVRESERYKKIPDPIQIEHFQLLKHIVHEDQILNAATKVA